MFQEEFRVISAAFQVQFSWIHGRFREFQGCFRKASEVFSGVLIDFLKGFRRVTGEIRTISWQVHGDLKEGVSAVLDRFYGNFMDSSDRREVPAGV